MTLPGIVAVRPAPEEDGEACHCFCAVRHRTGICEGYVGTDAVRVHYESAWTASGVLSCHSCFVDLPETQSEVPNIWSVPDSPAEWTGPASEPDDGGIDG